MQNSHVVELYNQLVADETQLTYYDSGIGTYVAESNIFVQMKQWIENTLDMAIALFVNSHLSVYASCQTKHYRHHKRITLSAYQWLSENYLQSDRVYLFGRRMIILLDYGYPLTPTLFPGFSRGAYQVRIISGMIKTVCKNHSKP